MQRGRFMPSPRTFHQPWGRRSYPDTLRDVSPNTQGSGSLSLAGYSRGRAVRCGLWPVRVVQHSCEALKCRCDLPCFQRCRLCGAALSRTTQRPLQRSCGAAWQCPVLSMVYACSCYCLACGSFFASTVFAVVCRNSDNACSWDCSRSETEAFPSM